MMMHPEFSGEIPDKLLDSWLDSAGLALSRSEFRKAVFDCLGITRTNPYIRPGWESNVVRIPKRRLLEIVGFYWGCFEF